MKLKKREALEEISLGNDDGSVFFDSETGNTYVLDDIAVNILSFFNTVNEPEKVINMLQEMYNEDSNKIKKDFYIFLDQLIKEGLLCVEEKN